MFTILYLNNKHMFDLRGIGMGQSKLVNFDMNTFYNNRNAIVLHSLMFKTKRKS